jgi:hypothetical protein
MHAGQSHRCQSENQETETSGATTHGREGGWAKPFKAVETQTTERRIFDVSLLRNLTDWGQVNWLTRLNDYGRINL